ncbi:MAG: hypothetical protein ACRDLA_18210, partial [Thermoleophilaceae bacterium]
MSFSKDSERGAGGMPTDAEIEMLLADELAALTAGPVDALRRRRHIATAAASVRTSRRVERRPARLVPRRPIAAAVMGAAAALAVVLSLASARLLPDPVQSAVAHVAEGIGIELPTPDDDREADAGPRSGGSRSITADP